MRARCLLRLLLLTLPVLLGLAAGTDRRPADRRRRRCHDRHASPIAPDPRPQRSDLRLLPGGDLPALRTAPGGRLDHRLRASYGKTASRQATAFRTSPPIARPAPAPHRPSGSSDRSRARPGCVLLTHSEFSCKSVFARPASLPRGGSAPRPSPWPRCPGGPPLTRSAEGSPRFAPGSIRSKPAPAPPARPSWHPPAPVSPAPTASPPRSRR